jgi:hypothetical protein
VKNIRKMCNKSLIYTCSDKILFLTVVLREGRGKRGERREEKGEKREEREKGERERRT